MKLVTIPIPDELPQVLKMSDEEFGREARMLPPVQRNSPGPTT